MLCDRHQSPHTSRCKDTKKHPTDKIKFSFPTAYHRKIRASLRIFPREKGVSLQREIDNKNIHNMKRILLTICFLASTAIAFGQAGDGFFLTLREDLIDFSMPINNNLNPTRTSVSHIFGTELSAGYRLALGDEWSVGLSAGLMLHDYSWTNTFESQGEFTVLQVDGSTHTSSATHSGQTTLNLPLLLNVQYHFTDWAENNLWEVVPMLSARVGYVVGLTSIKSHFYDEYHFAGDATGDIETSDYTFDKQGFHLAFGIGASYRHFDLELEYAMQPNHYVGTQHQQFIEADGTTNTTTIGPQRYAFAAGDGLTLRLTFNF